MKVYNNRIIWSLMVLPLCYLGWNAGITRVEKTRISESSLLTGLVDENFVDRAEVSRYLKSLHKIMDKNSNSGRIEYVYQELKNFDVEVYEQTFHSNLTSVKGTNLVGFIRAARALPTEAILIAVRVNVDQHHTIATILALIRFAKAQNYWARDLIFLFVDGMDADAGTLSWLKAYNRDPMDHYLQFSPITHRSGKIIGGVVLDMRYPKFTHLNIQYTGINGLLPNLDVFNMFVNLCEKHGVGVAIHDNYKDESIVSRRSFWRGATTQSFNELEGIHSVLNHYRIHSVTLKGSIQHGFTKYELKTAVKILEGGLRSFNNLLEKFHQSYFFYYLVTPEHFLSIAYYFPANAIQVAMLLMINFYSFTSITDYSTSALYLPIAVFYSSLMYYGHLVMTYFIMKSSTDENSLVKECLGQCNYEHWGALIFSVHYFWPWYGAPKLSSRVAFAILEYVLSASLLVFLLCLSLVNPSLALYVGLYVLCCYAIIRTIPRNIPITRFFYAILMHPVTFYVFFANFCQLTNVWPVELEIYSGGILDFSFFLKYLSIESRRYWFSHLQHNSFFFTVYNFVLLPAHSIFISLLGWEFLDDNPQGTLDDHEKQE